MITTRSTFLFALALITVAPPIARGAASQGWLAGFPGFSPHHCYAFPAASTTSPDRALFLCADEGDAAAEATFHLAFRAARRSLRVETDQPLSSGSLDLREGKTYQWLEGWYYQLLPGQPSTPRLGATLRRAVASCADGVSRLWIAPDVVLALAPGGMAEWARLVLEVGSTRVSVDCADPALTPAAAAAGLRDLAADLGTADLRLDAWAVDGRFLRAGRFHRSAADSGSPVLTADAFEHRLAAAAADVEIEDRASLETAETYDRLRRALVHGPSIRPGEGSKAAATFVQHPEIYLLDPTPGGRP